MKKMHWILVLDRSGSMKDSKLETISGVNEKFAKIREEAEAANGKMETLISFYTFNHKVEPQYLETSVNFLQDLTESNYVCSGDTAMLDAVGEAITNVKDISDDTSHFLIVVSDGRERCSKKFTRKEVAELIKNRQDGGDWTVAYVGSNQNLLDILNLNIHVGNVAAYDAESRGSTKAAWSNSSSQVGKFMKARALGRKQETNMYNKGKCIVNLSAVKSDDLPDLGNSEL